MSREQRGRRQRPGKQRSASSGGGGGSKPDILNEKVIELWKWFTMQEGEFYNIEFLAYPAGDLHHRVLKDEWKAGDFAPWIELPVHPYVGPKEKDVLCGVLIQARTNYDY